MSNSYKIQQPITDLASLRREKQKLREHIIASDQRMKQTVREWPLTVALNGAQKVGSLLFQNNLTSVASGLLGFKSGKKSIVPSIIKAALLFAGTQVVKHFSKDKEEMREDTAEEKAEATNEDAAASPSA